MIVKRLTLHGNPAICLSDRQVPVAVQQSRGSWAASNGAQLLIKKIRIAPQERDGAGQTEEIAGG